MLVLIGALVAAILSARGQEAGEMGTIRPVGTVKLNRVIIDRPQPLHDKDEVNTLENSSATLEFHSGSIIRLGEMGTFVVRQPQPSTRVGTIGRLARGVLYYFSRKQLFESQIETEHAAAAPRGTEFVLEANDKWTRLTLFDGEAILQNTQGIAEIASGGTALAERGQAPRAVLEAVNIVQWWLHYPGVLNPDDLPWRLEDQAGIEASLAAYRRGDLRAALVAYPGYPSPAEPADDAHRIYLAALYLGVGEVGKAEDQLKPVPVASSPVRGLHWLIAAVQHRLEQEPGGAGSATEALGLSYYLQARQSAKLGLQPALDAAINAVRLSPNFGFGWARVAELEFSFGRTKAASIALAKALALSPANAEAYALQGFLLSAQNKLGEAQQAFNQALQLDAGLGDAWLGRGLIRIRQGDRSAGREDLRMAVIMEANRSTLHSYLGKAFADGGDSKSADLELNRARQLDPKDPTPLLYSALLNEQKNRFNTGIDELEHSQALNDNRALFRSRLLLDQDRAVRAANLAALYGNAGMTEVSVREAARAVAADYANSSAHLFLAESFDALRDPTRFNLRYETVWFNELLLANLLAPVGAGNLSQNISQQEYSRFFEGNRLGLSTLTEYRSDGELREVASQFGTEGKTSYAFDLDYQHNDGVRPNNDLTRIEWYTTLKHQLTAQDSILVLTKYQDYHSGDNFQYYDPSAVTTNLAFYGIPATPVIRPNFKFDEFQTPLVVAGYHREWSPGIHTLLLGGRLENDQRLSDKNDLESVLTKNASGDVVNAQTLPFDVTYRSQFEIFTGELNQIFQGERQHLVLGGRFQGGTFETTDRLTLSPLVSTNLAPYFGNPPADGTARDPFDRFSGYAYYGLEPLDNLWLTAGLAYDKLRIPDNFRQPPVSAGSTSRERFNPKAALIWSPMAGVTLRGVYSRSLGGVSFDESFRLEPTQLAGFNQAFRTIIPESLVGSVSAPTYDIAGGALDLTFKTRTYFGIQAELLNSEVRRDIGVFDFTDGSVPPPPPVLPSVTPQRLEYEERSVAATVNQLVSDTLSLGAQYRFTQSELHSVYSAIPTSVSAAADSTMRADLHRTTLFALFNHPSGFFARAETQWYYQDNSGLGSSDFYQCNAFLGYRLRRQRAEVTFGVLNINDADYRLNPLNPYLELPRERVFLVRLKINL